MYYKIEFKDRYQTLGQVKTIISMLKKDGWNEDHFEIVEVN